MINYLLGTMMQTQTVLIMALIILVMIWIQANLFLLRPHSIARKTAKKFLDAIFGHGVPSSINHVGWNQGKDKLDLILMSFQGHPIVNIKHQFSNIKSVKFYKFELNQTFIYHETLFYLPSEQPMSYSFTLSWFTVLYKKYWC